ncbi:head decoration protein [Pantoea agglomerans pv. betae]|uniref:head decoration protein n=1 Tax=Enterobacter agglomerans TaxID=549 RepID=UPI0007E543FE|nr:head decoration protein [Pantoea agglomerans]WHU82984.1 head decoration protein [Pantoea agglomerans pv. betae]
MTQLNQFGQNTWGASFRQDTFIPDQLIAGPLQLVTQAVKIATGETAKYVRGTLLGKIAASGEYTLCVKTAEDGSQTPCAILVDNVDATADVVTASVYVMGEFNISRITADVSWEPADLRDALRPYALFLKDVNSAPLTTEDSSV